MKARKAKLGMRVVGNQDPDNPEPGSPEFGERALERLQTIRRKQSIKVTQDPDLGKDDKSA